jgi:FtsZ-interacting cell division protein ZipA
MSIFRPFLAQNLLPTEVLPESWHWMGLTLKELLTMLGAVALVTLLLVLWAVYIRKGPRRHSHRHHRHEQHYSDDPNNPSGLAEDPPDSEATGDKRYRRKRRRRREHRARNPTLAETGGLPPLRSDRPPDPLP